MWKNTNVHVEKY